MQKPILQCACCGSTHLVERASGKTIRSLLRTAIALSEGKHLILYNSGEYGSRDRWVKTNRRYMEALAELVSHMGFLDTSSRERIVTVNGGVIINVSETSSSLRGIRPDLSEWIEVTEV